MTYGWAVLVVLLVLGVLFYAGVFNTGSTVPRSCSFPAGFTCNEFMVDDSGRLYLELGQATGRAINVTGVGCGTTAGMSLTAMNVQIPSGSHAWVTNTTVTCSGASSPAFKGKISVQYTTAGSTLTRNVTGDITFPLVSGGVDSGGGGVGAQWNASWAYYRAISVTTGASGNLTNFPAYFTLDTASLISAGKMNASCKDLRVVNATLNGTLSHEIEANTCNTSNTVVWFKLPLALSNSTTAYVFYGNSTANDSQNASGVWSNGYAAVYHFSDLTDSLGAYTLVNSGASQSAGRWGTSNTAYSLGSTNYLSYTGVVGGIGNSDMSIYAFFKPSTPAATALAYTVDYHYNGNGVNRFIAYANGFAGCGGGGLKLAAIYERNGVATSCSPIDWNYPDQWVAMSYRNYYGANYSGYANSTKISDVTYSGTGSAGPSKLYIGLSDADYGFHGVMDEVRISNVARSDDWMIAENGQTFTLGDEQPNS